MPPSSPDQRPREIRLRDPPGQSKRAPRARWAACSRESMPSVLLREAKDGDLCGACQASSRDGGFAECGIRPEDHSAGLDRGSLSKVFDRRRTWAQHLPELAIHGADAAPAVGTGAAFGPFGRILHLTLQTQQWTL